MRHLMLVGTLALGGCTRGVLLYEPTPVIVEARPPAPPPPEPVVAPAPPIVVRDAIYFATDTDRIEPASLSVLDDVASQIKAHPELVKIRVEGHTDNIGTRADNLALSRRRAIAVRAYLVQVGVEAERLLAEGYGPDNPIATNASEDGRAKNRRVAFTVLDRAQVVSYQGGAR